MRQPKTLKRAMLIGATALLGISATVGAAHAGVAQADDANTRATPKPAVTSVQHTDKSSGASAKAVNLKTGETKSVPVKASKDKGASAEAVDLKTGATKFVPVKVSKDSDKPEFCFVPVDGKVPAGATFVSDSADKPGLKTSTKAVSKGKGKGNDDKPEFCFEPAAKK
ncbi:hypothetical protein ACH4SK_03655 [Streptomyces inhibens]|uniref:hypothetical protein n=1 Tax=Streptomyces inhibens TaxID=2293571 RepID=UPI0037A4F3F0